MNINPNKIPERPDLPDEIKKASENKSLAVFIGAGISRFVGCTSWSVLASNLVKTCERENLINHFETEVLLKEWDMKKTITICNQILNNGEKFNKEMKKSLNDKFVDDYEHPEFRENEESKNSKVFQSYEEGVKIYEDLFKLNGLFITTNADRHIDKIYQSSNIIYKREKFTKYNIDINKLYKIHGSIVEPESLVFTVEQYLNTYVNTTFTDFLTKIFNEYTILFVGYGLNEFELLDYLFKSTNGTNKRHYYLKDYFKHEERIYEFDQMYFEQLGIELIPYDKGKIGYDQLKVIIANWVETINEESTVPQKIFDDIDEALENPL